MNESYVPMPLLDRYWYHQSLIWCGYPVLHVLAFLDECQNEETHQESIEVLREDLQIEPK